MPGDGGDDEPGGEYTVHLDKYGGMLGLDTYRGKW